MLLEKIVSQIAAELEVSAAQVNSAVELLDGGATVPFIARYRKEATRGLDDQVGALGHHDRCLECQARRFDPHLVGQAAGRLQAGDLGS